MTTATNLGTCSLFTGTGVTVKFKPPADAESVTLTLRRAGETDALATAARVKDTDDEWALNLLDKNGDPLPAGEYIFRITASTAAGVRAIAYGRIIASEEPEERVAYLRASLAVTRDRIRKGEHFIVETGVADGDNIRRASQSDLVMNEQRLVNQLAEEERAAAGESPIQTIGVEFTR